MGNLVKIVVFHTPFFHSFPFLALKSRTGYRFQNAWSKHKSAKFVEYRHFNETLVGHSPLAMQTIYAACMNIGESSVNNSI